jgi:NADPH-dependent curcumin reductase CurA
VTVELPTTQRRIVLRQRPVGLVTWEDVELTEGPVPELPDGHALLRHEMWSMDATVRSWLNDSDGYLPAVEIGDVVRASGIGRIVASRSPAFAVGDVAYSLGGLQEYTTVTDDIFTTRLDPDVELAPMLSIYGATGLTAYVGTIDIGEVKEGETFVVSAAAGATGSLAGQIAKIKGARVVGFAGTDEKCRFVVEELGFDACINHRTDDLRAALKEHCPKRVDVFFDNVGGRVLDAVLGRLAFGGRVVLCGAISVYNETTKPPGPANYLNLIQQRGRMQGFIAFDHWGRYDEIMAALHGWVDAGELRHVEHVYDGLESSVDALNALFTGANTGKVVVRL